MPTASAQRCVVTFSGDKMGIFEPFVVVRRFGREGSLEASEVSVPRKCVPE
jgi:hypothetical protein